VTAPLGLAIEGDVVVSPFGELPQLPDTRVHIITPEDPDGEWKSCIHLTDNAMPFQMLFSPILIAGLTKKSVHTHLGLTPAHLTLSDVDERLFITLRVDQHGVDLQHDPTDPPNGGSWTYQLHPYYWVDQPNDPHGYLGVWPD
jgi:hypothetical protein